MKPFICALAAAIIFTGCSRPKDNVELPTGTWRAALDYREVELPFNFELSLDSAGGYDITVFNAEERLLLDEVNLDGDSVVIPLHIFDASIKGIFRLDTLRGIFIKHYDPSHPIPFTAVYGQDFRFHKTPSNKVSRDFTGKYRVEILSEKDTTEAIGIFEQKGDSVTSTFLTTTGDYRYLQGNVINDTLKLSAFDGNHAYLFIAAFAPGDSLEGRFYTGKSRKTWVAWRDEDVALPDANSLTNVNSGREKMVFTFPDVDGNKMSFSDARFKNKVVVVQLLGSWCPNCMDETRYLVPWYNTNRSRGVEVVGLAFERKDDFEYASGRVRRMIDKLNVTYPILIAGTDDKTKASEKLPMLDKIISFPTTIFIGKDGNVKKIHTGFSGPGTGAYYDEFIKDFNSTIDILLKQDGAPAAEL